MKKTLLAVIPMTCLSVSANSEAGSRFNGVHAGIQGGIVNSFANVDSLSNAAFSTTIQNTTVVTTTSSGISTTVTKSANNQTLAAQADNHSRHNFAAGALNIGFGSQLPDSPLYLGGDLIINYAKRNSSASASNARANNVVSTISSGDTTTTININDNEVLNTQAKVKLNSLELDADLKAGIIVNPETMIYVKLGAAFNRLSIDSNSTLVINDAYGNPTYSNNALNLSQDKNVIGFRAGLGGECFLAESMTASIDYVYTWYGSHSLNGSGNILNTSNATSTNTFTNHTSANIRTQSLMLGINYYFHDLI